MITTFHTEFESPELIIHKTPESIIEAFWHCPLSEITDMGGVDENGDEVSFSAEQMIAGIEHMGVWGFSQQESNTVQIYVGPDAERKNVLFVLGHELGHLTGEQLEDESAEEERADLYGAAVLQAVEWADNLTQKRDYDKIESNP